MKLEVYRDEGHATWIIALHKGKQHLTMNVTDQELQMSQDPRAYLSNAIERLINQWNQSHTTKVPVWYAKKLINAPFQQFEDDDDSAAGNRPGSDDGVLPAEPRSDNDRDLAD